LYEGYPTEFASSTQQKKMISTPNQPVEMKNKSQTSMFRTFKVKRRQRDLLLLYFSQTFNMVVHELLLDKMRNLQNYSRNVSTLLQSYLSGRIQFVKCGEKQSLARGVTRGIP
jgi:hypothetical protein